MLTPLEGRVEGHGEGLGVTVRGKGHCEGLRVMVRGGRSIPTYQRPGRDCWTSIQSGLNRPSLPFIVQH